VFYRPEVARYFKPREGCGADLSKTGGGRKRRSSGDKPSGADLYGRGDPQEAAAFIAETSGELAKIARRHGLDMLANLLDMTHLEADEWLRNRRRLS
jgi:hypothetical protein